MNDKPFSCIRILTSGMNNNTNNEIDINLQLSVLNVIYSYLNRVKKMKTVQIFNVYLACDPALY